MALGVQRAAMGDLERLLTLERAPHWKGSSLRDGPSRAAARSSRRRGSRHQQGPRREKRSPEQLGATAAPLRIAILDTMTALDQRLVDPADIIADHFQRPAVTRAVRAAGPGDDFALQLRALILKDEADGISEGRCSRVLTALWCLPGHHGDVPRYRGWSYCFVESRF
ncbi:hypothetical protein ABZ642_44835 [Streptomyces sp. NPDC007157]|uniref:hypothetical protein n=1 Tax=Streptomyces sp. NPDC007157 TaxID=3154681 RepID=UPI0033D133D4